MTKKLNSYNAFALNEQQIKENPFFPGNIGPEDPNTQTSFP